MKWVRPLKKQNLCSSKLKRANLRLMSLQMCHQFLVDQGEYCVSGLGVSGTFEKMFSVQGCYLPIVFMPLFLERRILSAAVVPLLNVNMKSLCHVRLFATPWTVAYQAPLSMGFSRQ